MPVLLPRAELGEELACGFEPIRTRVARQSEAVTALGDEISAGPDHFVGGLGGGGGRD